MIRSLYIAATGMTAQQMNVDNIAGNLANVNTNAYKRSILNFEDLIYQDITTSGANSSTAGTTLPSGKQVGLGTNVSSIVKSFEQGALQPTPGVPLNIAIEGAGFLQVTLPDGDIGYTRDGALQTNQNGEIVNALGYIISPGLIVPDDATALTISQDGIVQVTIDNQLQEVGRLELAKFINPAGLRAIGNNIYRETEASGAATTGFADENGFGRLKQNFLENSNVNSVLELTELIKAQRAFEFNSRVIQTSERLLQTLVDTKA
jgi:flagellar basal-body rod protein FlgG